MIGICIGMFVSNCLLRPPDKNSGHVCVRPITSANCHLNINSSLNRNQCLVGCPIFCRVCGLVHYGILWQTYGKFLYFESVQFGYSSAYIHKRHKNVRYGKPDTLICVFICCPCCECSNVRKVRKLGDRPNVVPCVLHHWIFTPKFYLP